MKNYRVIVFGILPIATRVVMFLENLGNVEVGVVLGNQNPHNNDPWPDVPLLANYCRERNIPTYRLEEIAECFDEQEFDLGLSCRYSEIINEETILRFRQGIINAHGGLLPEFGGVYSANHTILKNSPVGGGTLHYVDKKIDTGAIIRRCEFKVEPDDTAYTIHHKTQRALEQNLKELIPEALEGKLQCTEQSELIRAGYAYAYYNKRSLEGLKEIKIGEMEEDEIFRRIRAFDFPGYEPAYIVDKNGNKIYLRYSI